MSDQPETLSAILAEMRLDADILVFPTLTPDKLRTYADRIEAAAERERDEDRQLAAIAESDEAFARCARCDRPERAPGNAAAMRAALGEVLDKIDAWRTDGSMEHWQYSHLFDICDAAIAAPARNCDRPFRSADEAIGVYVTERGDGPHLGYCDAIMWALAPAKGGDHA